MDLSNDFNLLSEENSDFDILLSPTSGKSDEEDEVFLESIGHTEKCVAVGIDLNCKEEKSLELPETLNWSPPNMDKFVDVFREANLLAQHYENQVEHKSKEMGAKIMHNKSVEQFIEESRLHLSLLKGFTSSDSPRKMTSVIRNTPLKLHQPGIWNKSGDNSQACLVIPLKSPKKAAVQATNHSLQPTQSSGDSSSLNDDKIAACTETTNFKEVLRDQPPICEPTKSMPSENLCPPKQSGSKTSNSMRKNGGSLTGRALNRVSSSTSSLHSSLRTSPSVRRSLSLNKPVNVSRLQAPKNSSRIAAPKSKLSNSTCASNAPSTKLLKPTNTCKLSTAGKVNRQGSGTQAQSNKGLQRISMATSKKIDAPVKLSKSENVLSQDLSSKSKPSLQTAQKSSVSSPGSIRPKITQPKKPLACSTLESNIGVSTPNKPLAGGMLRTPNVTNRRVSMTPNARPLSGLPTPLNRRLSSIPAFTPRTQPRPGSLSQQSTSNRNRSMSASGAVLASNNQKPLEKAQVLGSPNSSGDEMPTPLVPCFLDFSPDKTQTICQEKAKKNAFEVQIKENLLVGVDTKIRKIDDRPLIDLSNTPDHKRIAPLKALESLIDFSSPLILLSPADKENMDVNSPLVRF